MITNICWSCAWFKLKNGGKVLVLQSSFLNYLICQGLLPEKYYLSIALITNLFGAEVTIDIMVILPVTCKNSNLRKLFFDS
jgi:hypothetical protein